MPNRYVFLPDEVEYAVLGEKIIINSNMITKGKKDQLAAIKGKKAKHKRC